MTKYKCGHEQTEIFLDNNPLSIAAHHVWEESEGLNGDRSLCWSCWCEQHWLQMGVDSL